mgnify:CR=1 FL=1
MTLKRINRVQIGKIDAVVGSTAWDLSEAYAPADMVGNQYTDLEITSATTMEFTREQIAITGQRGDGETPAGVSGNKDASPSLAFYMRGLDLSGGAANAVNASTAAPQYDMLIEQATGGTKRNIQGEDVIAGSTRWVLQFGVGRVGIVGYAIGDVVGWVNPTSGKMETAPVVAIEADGADTIRLAGDSAVNMTGGFSTAPQNGDDIYGMRTYPIDQTAGERAHITVHGRLADAGIDRLFQGCMGSVAFSDADGLLLATYSAQAQTWTADQNAAGAPTFGTFTAPNLGPVSTRGARVLICADDCWGVDGSGNFTPGATTGVAVATAISAGFDTATDVQPRTAATGTNGRQGFVAVQNNCTTEMRLYHDGTTAELLASGSQTFGDGAALSFQNNQVFAVLMQFGDTPGNTVVIEIPAAQCNTTIGEEGGLATLEMSGRGYRPTHGTATARIHLL